MKRRAVFLDRDGVINQPIVREGRPYPPATRQETVIVSDAEHSLIHLRERGYLVIVVTNQPDVRRGTASRSDVEAIHKLLSEKLPIDDFFVCYHDDQDNCRCRKPLPGLLLGAAAKYGIDLPSSYLVGDRWRDIDAGAAAGCRTILIDRGYNERSPAFTPNMKVLSLAEAADWILEQEMEFN